MSVIKLDVRYRRPRTVRGREIYTQPKPSSEMVWEICPYLRMHCKEDRCSQCPEEFEDETYGTMIHGCYGLAEEVCRIIFAMQARNNKS